MQGGLLAAGGLSEIDYVRSIVCGCGEGGGVCCGVCCRETGFR